jgi:hypothetical protein
MYILWETRDKIEAEKKILLRFKEERERERERQGKIFVVVVVVVSFKKPNTCVRKSVHFFFVGSQRRRILDERTRRRKTFDRGDAGGSTVTSTLDRA